MVFFCSSIGYTKISAESGGLAAVANAALRNAIDAGQVVTKSDHEAVLAELYLCKKLRDIAIDKK